MTAERAQCPLCGCARVGELPAPRSDAAMLSDGHVLPTPIVRRSCHGCGAAFHATPPETDRVRAWFASGYSLGRVALSADAARAEAYCDWICGEMDGEAPARIVECGSGSGALLSALVRRFPGAEAAGCEPSLAQPMRRAGPISLYRGGIDALPPDVSAELVVAVNVVEHVADPVAFLRALGERIAPRGVLVIVCPDGDRPNMELLFLDHLWSFTGRAMSECASQAGWSVVARPETPAGIGDFRMYILRREGMPAPADAGDSPALDEKRCRYLETWKALDETLARRLSQPSPTGFGAGQMAALLRAYAPRIWARLDHLEIDDPPEAWPLDKPVKRYDPDSRREALLAVSPRSQPAVARRLAADGRAAVRFDDLISA